MAIANQLKLYAMDEKSERLALAAMRQGLADFHESGCMELQWRLCFANQPALQLKEWFQSSTLLTNEIKIYHLQQGALPEELADAMGAAFGESIEALELPSQASLPSDAKKEMVDEVAPSSSSKHCPKPRCIFAASSHSPSQ